MTSRRSIKPPKSSTAPKTSAIPTAKPKHQQTLEDEDRWDIPKPPLMPRFQGTPIARVRHKQTPDPRQESGAPPSPREQALQDRIRLLETLHEQQRTQFKQLSKLMSELLIRFSPEQGKPPQNEKQRQKQQEAAEALVRVTNRLIAAVSYESHTDTIKSAVRNLMNEERFTNDLKLLSAYFRI